MADVDLKVRDEQIEESEQQPEIPSDLNLLPLRDSVIYPMLIAPLSVARPHSVRLIDESVVGSNRVVGVIAQKDPNTEVPGAEDIFQFGCAVIVRTLVKMPDAVRLIVQGVTRFKILEHVHETPYLRAKVQVIEEPPVP